MDELRGRAHTGIWIRRQDRDQSVSSPLVGDDSWPPPEGNEAGQGPEGLQHRNKSTLVQFVCQPGQEDQVNDVENILAAFVSKRKKNKTHPTSMKTHVWDGQQIRREGAEAKVPEREGDVGNWRTRRYELDQPNDIDGPEVVVLERFPQALGGDRLPVVHVALGRIISEDSVNHNADLAVREPAIRSEPRLRLYRRSRHKEETSDAHEKGNEALDEEQPAPATPAVHTT